MTFEVLTAVIMYILVFWVVTPCGRYTKEHTASIFSPEDEGRMFLRKVCIYLQVHTAF
jgi:hypothetical protein